MDRRADGGRMVPAERSGILADGNIVADAPLETMPPFTKNNTRLPISESAAPNNPKKGSP